MNCLTILYGSQTGTAQEVSEQIARLAINRLFEVQISPLDDYPIEKLINCTDVVFIVSTTGDGEVPDNMKSFWKFLLKKSLSKEYFKNLNFSVFGLGDSSYSKFNAVARRLDVRLKQLGAIEFVARGLGDDQHELGYFGELYPWLKDVWAVLLKKYPLPEGFIPDDLPKKKPSRYQVEISECLNPENVINSDPIPFKSFYKSMKGAYDSAEGPYIAKLVSNTRITEPNWQQDVRHIELEIFNQSSKSPIEYNAGDIAYIYPKNHDDRILSFISDRLKLNPDHFVYIEDTLNSNNDIISLSNTSGCSIHQLFVNFLDILGTPKRYFFERLSLFAKNEEESEKLFELSSAEGADLLHDYCTREKRNYIEVFEEFKSCELSLEIVLDLVPCIQPRAYSISSSSLMHVGKVHLTIGIVQYQTPYKRERIGICSKWIQNFYDTNTPIPIWIRPGLIKLPNDQSKPLILVGPGTGIAPMRALIEERRMLASKKETPNIEIGQTLLFFGCRHETKDFLYGKEFKNYVSDGTLSGLYTAFSRDQDYKIYVQARLAENKTHIYKLLLQGACIFIAGSAKRMPSDIYEIIRDIIRIEGEMTLKDAEKYMKKLSKDKRYIVEAWS